VTDQLRMRDVTRRTGLSRQAIHFYVAAGLISPPRKTGKTMAYYNQAQVERILLIRKLQEEHFLPLKAIRAMLDDREGEFSRAQQQVLRAVKARLPAPTTRGAGAPELALTDVLARARLSRREVRDLEAAGFVRVERGKVSRDDAWLIELWGEVRRAGFSRELGFGPELLALFARGIERMFGDEKQVLARLIALVPAVRVAEMIDRALPLIHAYLVRLHETKVRELFATIEAA
jgi:DNA-binding transcriptional MerR regulator